MIKPEKLKKGDKVATITLSWGGAGDIPERYKIGKKQLQEELEVEVVETRYALRSADWIYKNPQARAEDLMEAFSDKSIKAIFSNIGGSESVRICPFIDLNIIKNNPKIFMGYSDTTVSHFSCYKAGLVSFYGTSVMTGFAENGGMHKYTLDSIKKTLFSSEVIGEIKPNADGWACEKLEWSNPENQNIKRKLNPSSGWDFLQGENKVQGKLIGGCFDVISFLKGTDYWIDNKEWKDSIIFIETSEVTIPPDLFEDHFRNYATQGILQNAKGIIFARPYYNKFSEEYKKIIMKVINENDLNHLPIITDMDFGHIDPVFTIPYGIMAEIDPNRKSFSIIENAVI